MALIKIIPPEMADGPLAEAYRQLRQKRGKVANILQVHSLRPSAMLRHVELYLDLVFGPGPLTRAEREAIAVAVSRANDCDYCVEHHAAPLAMYIRDEGLLSALKAGQSPTTLPSRMAALVGFARALTLAPQRDRAGQVAALRDAGFDDEQILLATLVTAYFNFVNRIALGLGVTTDAAELAGYRNEAQ